MNKFLFEMIASFIEINRLNGTIDRELNTLTLLDSFSSLFFFFCL